MADLGQSIAALRGGRTQVELARRAGIDPATWSLYERGRRMPRPHALEKLAEALGVSVQQLEATASAVRAERLAGELWRVRQLGLPPGTAASDPRGVLDELFEAEGVPLEPWRQRLQAALGQLAVSLEEVLVVLLAGKS
ncbi:MAG TPA: helix-turn-helix transcriptional regulator [Thermoanaerobaculia bacterium]|nr:helix-turn-helix transcriptional regulator [Thermoanaerobaculia bacterium]